MRWLLIVFSVATVMGASIAVSQQPRDVVRERPVGTSTLSGLVTSRGEQSAPLRRVRVSIDGLDVNYSQTSITSDDGTYRVDGLPAGHYTVRGAKDGYLSARAGARRPGLPGQPVVVGTGEHVRVDLQLARGAVITGRVMTNQGEPAVNVVVSALAERFVAAAAERRLVESGLGSVLTDDQGTYRIYGLAPGEYFIQARPANPTATGLQVLTDAEIREALSQVSRSLWSGMRPGSTAAPPRPILAAEPNRPTRGLTRIYHPGTPFIERAARISLGESETRGAVDIELDYVTLASIEGTVSGPPGAARTQVTLASTAATMAPQSARGTVVDAEGRFFFRAVPPGSYRLLARAFPARPTAASVATNDVGMVDLVVSGDDLAGVSIQMRPGLTISGRVVFDPPVGGSLNFMGRPLLPLVATNVTGPAVIPTTAFENDRFTVSGIVPGPYRYSAALPGVHSPIGGWWLKSVSTGGRELLDAPIEISESATDAVLHLSDRAGEVSGRVLDAGTTLRGVHVVLFSRDERTWFPFSRRIAAVRVDEAGRYVIRNLPAGDYLAVAAPDLGINEWFDVEILRALRAVARPLSVHDDAGALTLDLPLRPR